MTNPSNANAVMALDRTRAWLRVQQNPRLRNAATLPMHALVDFLKGTNEQFRQTVGPHLDELVSVFDRPGTDNIPSADSSVPGADASKEQAARALSDVNRVVEVEVQNDNDPQVEELVNDSIQQTQAAQADGTDGRNERTNRVEHKNR